MHKKIIIGAEKTCYKGWLSTNINQLNVLVTDDFYKYWQPSTLINILAEHVWEYFTPDEIALANSNCYLFLKEGCTLRIAVPDGYHPDSNYIQHVKEGNSPIRLSEDKIITHKILLNYKSLSSYLQSAGFKSQLIEYWDEFGNFHSENYTDDNGYIIRSAKNDPRNKKEPLNYTSLIIDATK